MQSQLSGIQRLLADFKTSIPSLPAGHVNEVKTRLSAYDQGVCQAVGAPCISRVSPEIDFLAIIL